MAQMALSFIGAAWVAGTDNAVKAMQLFELLPNSSGKCYNEMIDSLEPLPMVLTVRGQNSERGTVSLPVLVKQALLGE